MIGKHRLQKPTRVVGLWTWWKVSTKTDEIMGNSGTATAVPAVPRAAPLTYEENIIYPWRKIWNSSKMQLLILSWIIVPKMDHLQYKYPQYQPQTSTHPSKASNWEKYGRSIMKVLQNITLALCLIALNM